MSSSATVFSYAQAAKGLAPSTQSNSTVPSSTSSEHGGKENASTEAPAPPKARLTSTSRDTGSHEVVQARLEASPSEQSKTVESPQTNREDKTPIDNPSAQQPPPTHVSDITSRETQVDAGSAIPTADQTPTTDGQVQPVDGEKTKDLDDDWEKVSVPSVAAEKELKAAPIPTVNIWQQRKEAQDAKLKDVVTQKPASSFPSSKPAVSVQTSVEEPKRRQSNKEAAKDGDSISRQTHVSNRSSAERKESTQISPRSSPYQDSRTTPTLRPTADTESWPTPDTSHSNEDRRRSSVIEKSDRTDMKTGSSKKWVQMPFVPTAKFETQLPPAAARRGGRPANRGRDGGARGGANAQHASHTEKAEAGSMGPPPLPNKSFEHERGRKHTGPQNHRASSVPSQGQRASSTDNQQRDGPRYSVPNSKPPVESTKSPETFFPKSGTANGEELSLLHDSRSSSRHTANQAGVRRNDSDRKNSPQAGPGQAMGLADSGHRYNSGDRYRNSYYESTRTSIDHHDGSSPTTREWSRSRPDAAREKNDGWRGRDSRPERGRGGYRGRGSHANYGTHMSPTSYSPVSGQNGLDAKSVTSYEGRNTRQASQPFTQTQSMAGNRNNPRSQSIPVTMMQGGYYSPVQGFPQALSPTDVGFGQYQQQMPNGIMSAMPYADQLNSYALISMVITQLEYYFSIDNLCKDMFLRKNMDSQGFVSLSVIANFKRIKALTDGQMGHDQLRSVCQQVRNIEFVVGENGEDKLRSRENWRDFVLPVEERLPAAQNGGPTIRNPDSLSLPIQGDHVGTNGTLSNPPSALNGFIEPFSPAGPPMGYSHIAPFDGASDFGLDGSNSQVLHQGRRESTTSPFSNIQSPPAHEHARSPSFYASNGYNSTHSHGDPSGNVFPDDKIPELKVVVRDPAFELPPNAGGAEQSSTADALSLRGGATSPEQLSRIQPLQFGQTPTSPGLHSTDEPPYWTKDGEIAQIPTGPGFVHEDYLPLREKALAQRRENHLDGALRVLYAFWSSFLVGHFNLSMYEEFSTMAKEDLEASSEIGKSYLVSFYDSLLTSRNIMTERIASDIVILARAETGERRPLWQKLRAAWRNGATNMKTRKRLGDVLTSEEKTEFDKLA